MGESTDHPATEQADPSPPDGDRPGAPPDTAGEPSPGPAADVLDALDAMEALDAIEARARRRAVTLQRDLDAIIASTQATNIDDEHDPEGATLAFERAQVTQLLRSAHAELARVEVARRRVHAGEADVCTSCGGSIGAGRRAARPTATHCVRCAASPT